MSPAFAKGYGETCGNVVSVVSGFSRTYNELSMKTATPATGTSPERKRPFTTISGRPVDELYTPKDIASLDYQRDLADPGEFPYTRGIHPTGYRGKLWTMRQFAGFGTPEETNERYRQLLEAGGTGTECRL